AIDRHTTQRRGTDVEDHFLACRNGDLVAGAGDLSIRPGGAIRPARRLDSLRGFLLSRFDDSGDADEGEGWNEQRKKEQPILFFHGVKPPVFPARREEDSANLRRQIALSGRRNAWRTLASRPGDQWMDFPLSTM